MRISRKNLARGALAALSGLLSGSTALAVAELVSAAVRPEAGPVTAVGGAAIDRTQAPMRDWAIRNFGENDKLIRQLGTLATLAAPALALGLVAPRYRRTGAAGLLVCGVMGAADRRTFLIPGTAAAVASRVGTALVVPKVNAETWRLRIHGKRTR